MSATRAIWINKNVQHFDTTQIDDLTLRLDPAGNLSSTAAGLAVTSDAVNGRGSLDPAGNGGTVGLPTAGGAETTQNNGDAIAFGDYYLVTTAGTIGTGLTVTTGELPAILIYNGGTITADAGWSLTKNSDTSGLTPQTRTLTAGNGLTGGGDLSADLTFAAQADVATGGDVKPANITANGIGVNETTLRVDKMIVDWNPGTVTPDAAGAIANGAPVGTTATSLAALLEGINDRVDGAGATVQTFTLAAGDITGGVTLSGTPAAPTQTIMSIAGAPAQVYTDDFTVAGTTLSFTAGLQALLAAGDRVTVQWK